MSCNLVLTFTAQRLLVIVFPLRFHKITMESKSKYVVMFLILVGCFLYSFVFFTYDIRDGRCSFVNNNNNNTNLNYFPHVDLEIFVHILDSTFTFFIPFFGKLCVAWHASNNQELTHNYFTYPRYPNHERYHHSDFEKFRLQFRQSNFKHEKDFVQADR